MCLRVGATAKRCDFCAALQVVAGACASGHHTLWSATLRRSREAPPTALRATTRMTAGSAIAFCRRFTDDRLILARIFTDELLLLLNSWHVGFVKQFVVGNC